MYTDLTWPFLSSAILSPPTVLRFYLTMPQIHTNASLSEISQSYRDYCALVERNDQDALAGLPPLQPHPVTGVDFPFRSSPV